MSRGIGDHLRRNVVGYIALFVALSGTAYAVDGPLAGQNTVGSADIINGEVYSADVRNDSLTDGGLAATDLRAGSVGSSEVLNESLTGTDIANGGVGNADIGPDAVTSSRVANGSLFGVDIADNSLTGDDIQESALSVANMGCQAGKVLGFARVKAESSNLPFSYSSSSTYVDVTNNCTGGAVQVRRPFCCGIYYVKFVGNPAALAVVSPNSDREPENGFSVDNTITAGKVTSGADAGAFRVETRDVSGSNDGSHQDIDFTILLP